MAEAALRPEERRVAMRVESSISAAARQREVTPRATDCTSSRTSAVQGGMTRSRATLVPIHCGGARATTYYRARATTYFRTGLTTIRSGAWRVTTCLWAAMEPMCSTAEAALIQPRILGALRVCSSISAPATDRGCCPGRQVDR